MATTINLICVDKLNMQVCDYLGITVQERSSFKEVFARKGISLSYGIHPKCTEYFAFTFEDDHEALLFKLRFSEYCL